MINIKHYIIKMKHNFDRIFDQLDGEYFFHNLRKYAEGFYNVKFEGF